MSKRLTERTDEKKKNRDRRPTAIARYIRIPSSKVELVLNLIRGKMYTEAAAILRNANKSGSPVVLKVLESAAANAENNQSIIKDSLYVAECYATAGPTMKRMMPRARGRADRILKRTCHIRIILDTKNDDKKVQKTQKNITKAAKNVGKTIKNVEKTAENNENLTKKAVTDKVEKKEIPIIKAEKPIANEPNTQKPLGTKAVAVKDTAKPQKKPAAKGGK